MLTNDCEAGVREEIIAVVRTGSQDSVGRRTYPVRWRLAVEHNASDYRMMSSMCLVIANAMSLESDRVRLTAKAQEWLELAHQAEAKRLPEITQGQYTGSVCEAVEPPKQSNTTAKENLDIGDNSADEVMLDRAPASQDYRPEIVDDAPGGTPCSLDGRTGADRVDEGSRNIASVSALEASVPKKLGTQPGELNAGVQCAGSAHEAVESRTQSNAIAEENLDIADCPAVDEVRPDRAFASQDSQTQADPIANEILEIADGPALAVAPGGIPGSPGGRTEANPVAEGLLKIPSVPAVETSFPQPPSQSAKPNAGMHRASHGVVTSRSWPMLTRLLLLTVFALFLTALFATMLQ